MYEKDIRFVKQWQDIYFTVAAKPGELLKAKIHAIGKTFETDPKALHVHSDVHNEDKDLLPGMYVEGRIVQDKNLVYAVPEDAVIKEGEQFFIFILDEESKQEENKMKFRMIPLTVGLTDLGFVEINFQKKMATVIRVVTKGAYTLPCEMIKRELEHAH